MSELAFNLNGEPFELPATAVGWRVRRIKGRGAPEVVYSREGVPLIVPIDTDIDDLRHAARGEGRFRLDPVDEHNRMIPQSAAGYVCVQPSEDTSELAPLVSRTPSDNVAIEAMRMNTELARTIIDRFPMMMDSAATLIRAADGAGIPAREPRPIVEPSHSGDDEDDEDDEEDDDDDSDDEPIAEIASKRSGWESTLEHVLDKILPMVMPAVMSAIASGKLKIPGGVGALFDARTWRPNQGARSAAAASHATSTPGAAPAPGPRDPAPASDGIVSPRPADPDASGFVPPPARAPRDTAANVHTWSPASGVRPRDPAPVLRTSLPASGIGPRDAASIPRTSSPASSGPRERSFDADEVSTSALAAPTSDSISTRTATPASRTGSGSLAADASGVDVTSADVASAHAAELAVAGDATTGAADELPILDAAALAHFAAIQAALTFREGMLARALAAELTPPDLRSWLTELRDLPISEAVARIRRVLGEEGRDDTEGGAS